jgi:hypothetical protein
VRRSIFLSDVSSNNQLSLACVTNHVILTSASPSRCWCRILTSTSHSRQLLLTCWCRCPQQPQRIRWNLPRWRPASEVDYGFGPPMFVGSFINNDFHRLYRHSQGATPTRRPQDIPRCVTEEFARGMKDDMP